MALAIDASSPAVVKQATSSTANTTTASFTPPAGSILLVRYANNSASGVNPSTPTITDNRGTHLTYTPLDWQSRADSPNVDGQIATWWANVTSSVAMTVTVTSGVATNVREAALSVIVITGQHATTPIGAHGKTGSSSASSIAQGYTASATSGWGFLGVCDWNATGAETAGSGCTIESSGDVSVAQISYAFARRTTADDSIGNTNTLNTTLGSTSTALVWAWVEVLPAASSTVNGSATIAGAGALAATAVQGVVAGPTGAGTVAAAATQGAAASPTGVGSLSVAATQRAGASPAGAGSLAGNVVQAATAAATGAGALFAAAVQGGTASLVGAGSLTATTAGTIPGVAAPTGAGTLTAAATQRVVGSLTGAGSVSAAGSVTVAGVASLAGAGTLASPATLGAFAAPAGAGVLAAKATQSATASPTAVGVLTVPATLGASAALVGAGTVQAATTASTQGTAFLVGAGVLTAAGDACHTPRPFTGVTARPSTGTTARPNAGVTTRPC